ncbi:MAG: pilin [Arenimonas sp.]|nr:pilin [Arenimonas sp.]
MKNIQKGFTLIELMIVVAIIAILAAIALPLYQDYIARSQATAGLADIRGGVTAYEEFVQRGSVAVITAPAVVGLSAATPRCSAVAVTASTSGTIVCTLQGNPIVAGKTITLTRTSATGQWACSSNISLSKHKPGNCA